MIANLRLFLILFRKRPLPLQRRELRLRPGQLLLQLQHLPFLGRDRSQKAGTIVLLRLEGQRRAERGRRSSRGLGGGGGHG